MRTFQPTEVERPVVTGKSTGALPTIAFLIYLAVLPLEWMTLVSAGGGFIKPFHVAAIALIGLCAARWRLGPFLGPVWRRHTTVFGAYTVLLAVAFAGGLAYPEPFLSRVIVLRQVFYLGTALFICALVVTTIGRRAQWVLAVSGLVSSLTLSAAFSIALLRQHANPIQIVADAIAQTNPDIITYRLLRSTFRTDDELAEVAANLRHKVFVGLLVAVFLGLACGKIIERRQRILRGLLALGGAFGFGLVTLSLSRSTTACMVLPLMLYPLRLVVQNRSRPGQAVTLVVALAAVFALLLSPVGDLLFARFTATGSYQSRLTAAGPSFIEDFETAALLGIDRASVEKSPHNFVLHSWLSGGILAGSAAVVLLVSVAWTWFVEVKRYLTGAASWVIPVEQIWVLGLGVIPLVRAFSSGNQFHVVEWTAIALFLAFTFGNQRARRAVRA